MVGLHQVALGVVHLLSFHLEVGALHWYAGSFVHHESREPLAVDDVELAHRLVVAVCVEGNSGACRREFGTALSYRRHVVCDARLALV